MKSPLQTLPVSAHSARRRFLNWRAAGLALALCSTGAVISLSGCGGGGGGGNSIAPLPDTTVTFQLFDQNGLATSGTVTLQPAAGGTARVVTSTNNRAVFDKVKPGNYQVVFVIGSVTTTGTVSVSFDSAQIFALTQGTSSVPNQGITVSGRVLLNTGNANTSNCNAASAGVTARVVVRVRDINKDGSPIVASTVKADQTATSNALVRGTFTVSNLPGPGTYVVEVRQAGPTAPGANDAPAPFTGRSPVFTISAGETARPGITICANQGTFAPGDAPTTASPTPTATATATGIPTSTATATATATATSTSTATATATATATTTATATATATIVP
jgi:hypothetical protein